MSFTTVSALGIILAALMSKLTLNVGMTNKIMVLLVFILVMIIPKILICIYCPSLLAIGEDYILLSTTSVIKIALLINLSCCSLSISSVYQPIWGRLFFIGCTSGKVVIYLCHKIPIVSLVGLGKNTAGPLFGVGVAIINIIALFMLTKSTRYQIFFVDD